MSWFYQKTGAEVGPIEGGELYRLVQGGELSDEVLIRRDDETQFRPFRDYFPYSVQAPSVSTSVMPEPEAVVAADPDHLPCIVCEKRFAAPDLLAFAGSLICAGCKPSYFQELREGVIHNDVRLFSYAGFWLRGCALCIDSLLFYLFSLALVTLSAKHSGLHGLWLQSAALAANLSANLSYFTVCHAWTGKTAGKYFCKIRVVNPDGTRIGFLKSLARYFANLLSRFLLGIGYIIAAFDPEKRALHDRLCNTRVIQTNKI